MAGLWDLFVTPGDRPFPGREYIISFMERVALHENYSGADALNDLNEILRHSGPPASFYLNRINPDTGVEYTQEEADAIVSARELTAEEVTDLSNIYNTISGNTTQKLVALHRIVSSFIMTELAAAYNPNEDGGNGWGGLSRSSYDENRWRTELGIPFPGA